MDEGKLIWILEDDAGNRSLYEDILGVRYQLRFFEKLAGLKNVPDIEAYGKLPNLLIADLKLPDGNFLQDPVSYLIQKCPTIVVSAVDDLDVLRNCYNEGIADYLTKPFGKSELVVKVERIFGRETQESPRATPFKTAPLDYRVQELRVATSDGQEDQLTVKENQIFSLLYQNWNRPVPKGELTAKIWPDVKVGTKTLDVHVFNLRRKLSVLGVAIQFCPPDAFILTPISEADTINTKRQKTE